jgi:O-succinylbenzoate synthase
MPQEEEYEGTLLTITAEIISKEPKGFIIRIHNDEKQETVEVSSTREYAQYLIESVNTSVMDNFVAKWLPSPNARRRDIDLIGMELGMMQEWMEKELLQSDDIDDGGLIDAVKNSK